MHRLFIFYIFIFLYIILQVEEATVRAAGADKDHRKELDAMLSSLGVAPVSGKQLYFDFIIYLISYIFYFIHRCIIQFI